MAETPPPAKPESGHLTRVTFTVSSVRPNGKLDRIESQDAHLAGGKATAEVTLWTPEYRDDQGKRLQECEFVFKAKYRDGEEVVSAPLMAKNRKDLAHRVRLSGMLFDANKCSPRSSRASPMRGRAFRGRLFRKAPDPPGIRRGVLVRTRHGLPEPFRAAATGELGDIRTQLVTWHDDHSWEMTHAAVDSHPKYEFVNIDDASRDEILESMKAARFQDVFVFEGHTFAKLGGPVLGIVGDNWFGEDHITLARITSALSAGRPAVAVFAGCNSSEAMDKINDWCEHAPKNDGSRITSDSDDDVDLDQNLEGNGL